MCREYIYWISNLLYNISWMTCAMSNTLWLTHQSHFCKNIKTNSLNRDECFVWQTSSPFQQNAKNSNYSLESISSWSCITICWVRRQNLFLAFSWIDRYALFIGISACETFVTVTCIRGFEITDTAMLFEPGACCLTCFSTFDKCFIRSCCAFTSRSNYKSVIFEWKNQQKLKWYKIIDLRSYIRKS